MFNIIIRHTDEVRIAFLRKIYPSKCDALTDIEKIKNTLPRSILGKRKIIINYEIEYKEKNFDLAACMEITGSLPKNTEYEEKTINFPQNVASLVCQKDELDNAYTAMIKHLDGVSYKVCGAYYEIYHNDNTVELKVPVCKRTNIPLYHTQKLDLPFEDDPEACGKWQMLDILPTPEHFVYGRPKCGHLAWLNEIYFIDAGQSYWSVYGWTKGYLFTYGPPPESTYVNKYTIKDIGGRKLLFLEMYDYCDGGALGMFAEPEYWVYEKIEDRHYASPEDVRRCDNIDYPFVNDPDILGVWKAKDISFTTPDDFDPKHPSRPLENLYYTQIEFKEGGVFVSTTKRGINSGACVWTKGLILHKGDKTASAYFIKEIDGVEYLFREWKNGDYVFGNGRAYWLIFTRA